jgi:hypothetical protein
MAQTILRTSLSFVLVFVLALAGCGGGDSSSDKEPSGSEPQTETTAQAPEKRTPADRKAKKKPKSNPAEKPEKTAPPTTRGGKKMLVEKVQDFSPAKRARLIAAVLKPALAVLGLEGSTGTLSADLRTLTVVVPRSRACKASTTDTSPLEEGVRRTLIYVKRVVVIVEGGQSLPDYVAANCKRATVPTTRGRVVWEKSGFGVTDSPTLRIRSKRWVVSYASSGDYFSVFVRKGKKYLSNPITATEAESGRQTYKGPGRFKLDINGSGDWTVKVTEL